MLDGVKRWWTRFAVLLLAAAAWGADAEFDRDAAVHAYFDRYNAAIAETPWDGAGPRQVTWVQKVTAFERDGWKCVVCGSEGPLELDHAMALMNGGGNELDNLHTLCHECHVAKTRLDFALRRHRMDLEHDLPPTDPERDAETHFALDTPIPAPSE